MLFDIGVFLVVAGVVLMMIFSLAEEAEVEVLLAIASGVLYAAGIYLMLRRRLAQLIIGLGLLSNGTNLLIFTAGGLTRAHPPVDRRKARNSWCRRTPIRCRRRSS